MAYSIDVKLDAVNGGMDYAILTAKDKVFPYADKKKLSDEPIGIKLTVALQNARLTPLKVKFDHDPLPSVEDAQIEAACSACKFLFVKIPDCKVKVYPSSGGGLNMSATAETAEIVTPGK